MATPHSVSLTPLAWNDLLGLLVSARIYVTVAILSQVSSASFIFIIHIRVLAGLALPSFF